MSLQFQSSLFRAGELFSYLAGIALVGIFVVQLAQGEVEREHAVAAFEAQPLLAPWNTETAQPQSADVNNSTPAIDFNLSAAPDTRLWAPGRIADYQRSLGADLPPVLGVLEVASVNLKVPVYQTASELVLARAAGVIKGMAYPHEGGNIGISGHRDGYFRALKDVQVGDQIVLQTLHGKKRFNIETTTVVDKTDTTLLQDTRGQTVTLVTCYPFYFVGSAPQRFIVTASLDTTFVNHTRRN